jgi:hypothetical protein
VSNSSLTSRDCFSSSLCARSNGAISGSALSAAAWPGDEKVFFALGERLGVATVVDGAGRLRVLETPERREFVFLGVRGTLL